MPQALGTVQRCLAVIALVALSGCSVTSTLAPSGGAGVTPGSTEPATSGSPVTPNSPAYQAYLQAIGSAIMPTTGDQTVRRDALLGAMGIHESLGADADRILALASAAEATVTPGAASRAGDVAVGTVVLAVAAVAAVPPVPALAPELVLRDILAGATDAVGRPGSGTNHEGPIIGVATSNDGGLAANVQATTTVDALVGASNVTVTVQRDVQATVTDTASGSLVFQETRSHRVIGTIDVCPTAAGIVDGSVDNVMNSEVTSFPGVGGRVGAHATGSTTSKSTFEGHVDDTATLGVVTQNYVHDEKFHRSASADGGPGATRDGSFQLSETGVNDGVPAARDWSLAPGDHSKASGTVDQAGDVTMTMLVATWFSEADDYAAIDPAYVAAQKLWRTNRCVMVTSPTYNVESELVPSGLPAHTEEVDQGSSTNFDAGLKHRFGAVVTARITAELFDGKEKLTPTSIAKPPGTLTYQAPAENGKDALVKLTSTSRQGIGTLVIKFHTGAQKLKVGITGSMTTSGMGVSYTTTISVKDLVLSILPDGTYAGSAPATASILLDIADCRKPFVETGTFKLRATREVVESQALERRWTVTWDPATQFTTGGVCVGVGMEAFTGSGETGPIAGFMFVLGDLVFPERGDTQHIQRSKSISITTNVLDATVTGEIVSQ